jgi:hypothetical protein
MREPMTFDEKQALLRATQILHDLQWSPGVDPEIEHLLESAEAAMAALVQLLEALRFR